MREKAENQFLTKIAKRRRKNYQNKKGRLTDDIRVKAVPPVIPWLEEKRLLRQALTELGQRAIVRSVFDTPRGRRDVASAAAAASISSSFRCERIRVLQLCSAVFLRMWALVSQRAAGREKTSRDNIPDSQIASTLFMNPRASKP